MVPAKALPRFKLKSYLGLGAGAELMPHDDLSMEFLSTGLLTEEYWASSGGKPPWKGITFN